MFSLLTFQEIDIEYAVAASAVTAQIALIRQGEEQIPFQTPTPVFLVASV